MSHICCCALTSSLKSKESILKTLELLQEWGGSEQHDRRLIDAAIAALVVQMKAELEKLVEQVQNVE
ncbi:MAG: hypothetical protein U0231_16485 [Nitrospiraceae bacterium]